MASSRKQMWSNNKEAELIELWQQRECLYNVASKDYHDRSKKQLALREISAELHIPIGDIITRTSSLRTQYGKLMHPKPSGSAQKNITPRQQWIIKHLEFLKCHVLPRASLSTIELDFSQCENIEGEEEQEQEWAEDTGSPTTSTSSSFELGETPTPSPTSNAPQRLAKRQINRASKTTVVDSEDNLEREKVSLLKQAINNAIKTEDADDAFGKNVTWKLRQITDRKRKMKAELAITNILYIALDTDMPCENIRYPEGLTTQMYPTMPHSIPHYSSPQMNYRPNFTSPAPPNMTQMLNDHEADTFSN